MNGFVNALSVRGSLPKEGFFESLDECWIYVRGVLIEFQVEYRKELKSFSAWAETDPRRAMLEHQRVLVFQHQSEAVEMYVLMISAALDPTRQDSGGFELGENLLTLRDTALTFLVTERPWDRQGSAVENMDSKARASALSNVAQVAGLLAEVTTRTEAYEYTANELVRAHEARIAKPGEGVDVGC